MLKGTNDTRTPRIPRRRGMENEMSNARMPTTTPKFMFNSKKLNLTERKMFPFATIVMASVVPTQTEEAKMKLAIVLGPSEKTYEDSS